MSNFRPYVHRSENELMVYWSGDPDYSEQLTPEIMLYRSLDTNEVTGCRVVIPREEQEQPMSESSESSDPYDSKLREIVERWERGGVATVERGKANRTRFEKRSHRSASGWGRVAGRVERLGLGLCGDWTDS